MLYPVCMPGGARLSVPAAVESRNDSARHVAVVVDVKPACCANHSDRAPPGSGGLVELPTRRTSEWILLLVTTLRALRVGAPIEPVVCHSLIFRSAAT